MIKNLLKIYSFLIISVMSIVGFLNVTSPAQLISAVLFYPLLVYLWLQILPKRSKAINLYPQIIKTEDENLISDIEIVEDTDLSLEGDPISTKVDIDRRAFIKLIGSAGLSIFLLSLFTKRAQAAFFGSVPGPGTVAIKDSLGNQIDPAEKQPTDGYRVSQLDDSVPSYYGFTNKDGAWFVLKEDSSGNYRYAKGTSDFSTNWTNRAALSYDYFENVF